MTYYRLMTRTFFDRLVLRRPKTVIAIMFGVFVFLAVGIRDFRLDASSETLVLESDEDLRYSRIINSRYEQSDFLVLAYTPRGDLFSRGVLAELTKLRDELASLEKVTSVLTILDVPLLENVGAVKELTRDLPTLCSPAIDPNEAKAELRNSPLYEKLLLSPDAKTTALLVNLAGDEKYYDLVRRRNALSEKEDTGSLTPEDRIELKQVSRQFDEYRDKIRTQRHKDIAAIRRIMEKYRADADLFLGGVSMIADDMITFIKNDLRVFGLGVFFLLILSLLAIFKRIRWVVLPLLCCAVSAISMIGLLGWLGWEVTVVSSNFVSLQLIMTLSLAIHLIVRYRELLRLNPDETNHNLILETLVVKLRPCVYAVLTTIAGFASLVLCDILPVINFGWMMILGLVVSLIVTFFLWPSVLILLPKEPPPPPYRTRFSLLPVLASLTERHGRLIVAAAAAVIVLSAVGISRLQVENSFIDYFGKDTEIYQGMKVIDQSLGGTTPLDVIIDFPQAEHRSEVADAETDDVFDEFDEFEEAAKQEKYWFTADKMSRIQAVHDYLDSLPETGKVLSLANVLDVAEKLNKGQPLDSFELALLYSETPPELKSLMIEPYVSVEHNEARFWVRVRDSEKTLRRDELLKQMRTGLSDLPQLGRADVHLAGLLVLYNNMLQSLFDSQILTLGATVLILMAMFLVLFRSLKISLIAIAPNLLPIAFVLGFMGWLDIPLDMMTITIAAIGLGIAVDDTIHYIHRFKAEFQRDHKYIPAMHRCHRSIGHAMYYTSATIIIGFSILALSNFIPTGYFGLLTGLVMLIAIIAALTLLPQLIIMVKPFGKEA